MAAGALLENYTSLVDTFLEFLTIAIHLVLYERDIYPQSSFLKARKYNYPVRQNRHPAVCKFIDDAVAAVRVQMMKCVVSSVSLILHSPSQTPLERYVFSTISFPIVGPKEHLIPFLLKDNTSSSISTDAPSAKSTIAPATTLPTSHIHVADLHPQYTAVLERLTTMTSSLNRLPAESSFTLAIELRDQPGKGEPPIGWPMPFMPAEAGLQRAKDGEDENVVWTVVKPDSAPQDADSEMESATQETSSGLWDSSADVVEKANKKADVKGKGKEIAGDVAVKGSRNESPRERMRGKHLGGVETVPIRNVEAGPFMMEVWIEQNEDRNEVDVSGSNYKRASVEDE